MQTSNLKITGGSLTPWSGHNCQQTLTAINSGSMLRTVNGKLVYVAGASQQKYQSTITSQDQLLPAFGNLWRGQVVQIHCIAELWQQFANHGGKLDRPHVVDSVRVSGAQGQVLEFVMRDNGEFTCAEEGGFVSYRPILNMLVTAISQETSEWEFASKWCLQAEEE